MYVNHFNAKVVNSYEGDSFVQTDENYTWKATKMGEHAQSDYDTGTGTGTVSTGLSGVTGVKGQACYYSDLETAFTGMGEIPTIGTPPHTTNAHSVPGLMIVDILVLGVPTTDSDRDLDLQYFTTRDGVRFDVDVNSRGSLKALGSDPNYPGSGGAIRTGGVWYDTSGVHDMVTPHGVSSAIAFRPYDFKFIFKEAGFYGVSTKFAIADPPTTPFAADAEIKFVNATTGEIYGGGQICNYWILGDIFYTVLYIPEPEIVVNVKVKFVTMSKSGDFSINFLLQKLQTKDSNLIDTIV